MTELPATVPCPGCGEPADQVWCDASTFGASEPRMIPGEVTCHTEDCSWRIRREAELAHIAKTSGLAMSEALSYRGWDYWVGRGLIAITMALWVATIVLWTRG